MRVVLVTGPNGSGKTTLLKRVVPWPGLRVVYADTDPLFKKDPETVTRSFVRALSTTPDLLVEGTDRPTRALLAAAGIVRAAGARVELCAIVLSQEPDVMREHLRARCERYGKPFNAPYWDLARLQYEGAKRYPALVRKYAPPDAVIIPVTVDLDFKVLDTVVENLQTMAEG